MGRNSEPGVSPRSTSQSFTASPAPLLAYEIRLAEDGRRMPAPVNRERAPDRVQAALMAASEMIDSQRAGKWLLNRIHDVLGGPSGLFTIPPASAFVRVHLWFPGPSLATLNPEQTTLALRLP